VEMEGDDHSCTALWTHVWQWVGWYMECTQHKLILTQMRKRKTDRESTEKGYSILSFFFISLGFL
jgi:hypothetical protein